MQKQLHLDADRATPLGMFKYALQYYAASIAADSVLGDEQGFEIFAPIPVMFLMTQTV